MYLVGLTGGIGSGKSTVAARFAELGAEVIDADLIAREVVQPGEPALAVLAERFGADILRADGSLDRGALAARAFSGEASRADLDRITHPHIAARIAARIAELGARDGAAPDDLIVVDHPLLVETNQTGRFDAVVVVVSDEQIRLDRLVAERGMDEQDVRARMRAQVDDDRRRRVADHVIVNEGSVEGLHQQVDAVHAALLADARARIS